MQRQLHGTRWHAVSFWPAGLAYHGQVGQLAVLTPLGIVVLVITAQLSSKVRHQRRQLKIALDTFDDGSPLLWSVSGQWLPDSMCSSWDAASYAILGDDLRLDHCSAGIAKSSWPPDCQIRRELLAETKIVALFYIPRVI
ncbi:MAG: hypothetical protein IPM84_23740 [Anaerolineae bacterium]|nr:hypothetical protein [Anaerolineae bacterium]